eukprot:snap_masked-scaffold1028_size131186-processed-gene-0.14 protein:Tk10629 transcript:snap_masked-scaffold1028_size131186-processed-gene-0.14-mRNA-1 annotation:"Deoxyribonuclease-2-alpha"
MRRSSLASGLTSLLLVVALACPPASGIECRDEAGHPVDWYILYKLPRSSDSSHPLIRRGVGYAFLSSADPLADWTWSNRSIRDPLSLIGRTLAPLYRAAPGRPEMERNAPFHLLYNDEHPDGPTSSTHGHTKGVVAFDEARGFWLVHSVPKFPPPLNQSYGYPATGQKYGQSALCLSLATLDSAENLGTQLLYHRPFIYDVAVPEFVLAHYPNLASMSRGQHDRVEPYFHLATFQSLSGPDTFLSFAKYTLFGRDLYADWVAPHLTTGLLVETWPNGPGKMNSSCGGPFEVENVDRIAFGPPTPVQFDTHHDHSKWAIGQYAHRPYVCIGDINRMHSQTHRAGGTVCFRNAAVWRHFFRLIQSLEPCPRPTLELV